MRCAVVENGVVVNVIVADKPEDFNSIPCPDDTDIGDLWDGENFTKPQSEE